MNILICSTLHTYMLLTPYISYMMLEFKSRAKLKLTQHINETFIYILALIFTAKKSLLY